MAKRVFKINRKYTHFCVSKATGKIVDGWEYPKDYILADVMVYYKQDMKDNDRELKDYELVFGKRLSKANIDPFDTANWGNN